MSAQNFPSRSWRGLDARDPEGDALTGLLSVDMSRCGPCQDVIQEVATTQAKLLQRLHCAHDLLGVGHGGNIILFHEADHAFFVDYHDSPRRDTALRQVKA